MTVSFNSNSAVFNQMRNTPMANRPNFTSNAPEKAVEAPKAEVVEQEPKKKASFGQRFRNFCAGFQKGLITFGEYVKGTFKGLFYGGIGAAGVLGADAIRNAVKKAPATLSTPGKIIAGAVGVVVLGVQLFKSYLNANQKKAEVDHRWATGHNE